MVLLLPDGPSVGLDLDAARPRLLRLGDANGEDPVPVLRAGRLAGEPARDAYAERGRQGRIPIQDYLETKYARLDAEINLAQARAQMK